MKRKTITALVLLCVPATGFALDTLDTIRWPDEGRFPAYSLEPDERKVRLFVFGDVDRDSNPFRLSDTANTQATLGTTEKSDTVVRAGVGLKADLPVSRQRLLFDLRGEQNDYRRFDLLDHFAYRGSGTWRWQAGNQWSGEIGASKRRFLANLAELQRPIKDLVTEDRAFAGAGFLVTPRWKVRGMLDWTKWDHGEPTRQTLDARVVGGTIGLDYVTPPGNFVGGQVRYSEGDYPNRQLVAGNLVSNQYQEVESSAVLHWVVTGKSTFDARLGYTSRRHDEVPQRDFDGATGRLNYDWFIAAKTLLNFSVWRELRSAEDISASYVVSKGWGLGPAWAPTSKLVFQAKYLREDRDYRGDPNFVASGAPPRDDTFRGVSLTAGYAPRRNLQFSLGAERGQRESNIVGVDYDYTAVSANARVSF